MHSDFLSVTVVRPSHLLGILNLYLIYTLLYFRSQCSGDIPDYLLSSFIHEAKYMLDYLLSFSIQVFRFEQQIIMTPHHKISDED